MVIGWEKACTYYVDTLYDQNYLFMHTKRNQKKETQCSFLPFVVAKKMDCYLELRSEDSVHCSYIYSLRYEVWFTYFYLLPIVFQGIDFDGSFFYQPFVAERRAFSRVHSHSALFLAQPGFLSFFLSFSSLLL